MRVFFAIRDFSLTLNEKQETRLPLTPYTTSVVTEDIVDTSMMIQHSIALYSTAQYLLSTVLSTVQYMLSTVQYMLSTVQYSTVPAQYSTVQYSTCSVQYSTCSVQYSIVPTVHVYY